MSPSEFILQSGRNQKMSFYKICSSKENTLFLKRLMISLKSSDIIDDEFITIGLLAAIENKVVTTIDYLFDFTKNHLVKIDKDNVNRLYNCAMQSENEVVKELLQNKFQVVKHSLSTNGHMHQLLGEDGIIEYGFGIGGAQDENEVEIKMNYFRGDPFLFQLLKLKGNKTNEMLAMNDHQISASFVEDVFIEQFEKNKLDNILVLLNNKIIFNIIKESSTLKRFLKEPTQFIEEKKFVKSAIAMIELQGDLKNDRVSESRFKI